MNNSNDTKIIKRSSIAIIKPLTFDIANEPKFIQYEIFDEKDHPIGKKIKLDITNQSNNEAIIKKIRNLKMKLLN